MLDILLLRKSSSFLPESFSTGTAGLVSPIVFTQFFPELGQSFLLFDEWHDFFKHYYSDGLSPVQHTHLTEQTFWSVCIMMLIVGEKDIRCLGDTWHRMSVMYKWMSFTFIILVWLYVLSFLWQLIGKVTQRNWMKVQFPTPLPGRHTGRLMR